MLDLLIQNAILVDGTGAPAFLGSIGAQDGKIVMNPAAETAALVIDGTERHVLPGFIDAHSHGDVVLGRDYARLCKTSQGITTEICGQCGLSACPVSAEFLELGKSTMSGNALEFPNDLPNWTGFSRFLEYARTVPKTANFKMYIGHSTLRAAVMGFAHRAPSHVELERMKELLREAMEHGAAGLSTGLIYTPGCYADTAEIIALAKVIAPYGGIYASHIRNESSDCVQAVEEVLEVARLAGVAVCISHHKILGKSNWGLQRQILQRIREAMQEGLEVTCDQYPYTCNMTCLSACIPPWHFEKGIGHLLKQLKSPAFRIALRAEMENPDTPYDNYYLNAGGWEGVLMTSTPHTPQAQGKTVAQYADECGADPFHTYFAVLAANGEDIGVAVYSSMCPQDVCEIALAPNTVVGTDGVVRAMGEKGHPRGYATFPHAITYYVNQQKIMTLEEAVHRMTGLTAQRLHVPNKGILRDGYDADLLVIDSSRFQDRADYQTSDALTEGLDYVIVDGKVVMKDRVLTGEAPGKFIPHRKEK